MFSKDSDNLERRSIKEVLNIVHTCNISEDIKLLAICRSRGLSETKDSWGSSCKSSPRTPSHLTLQAGKVFFSFII